MHVCIDTYIFTYIHTYVNTYAYGVDIFYHNMNWRELDLDLPALSRVTLTTTIMITGQAEFTRQLGLITYTCIRTYDPKHIHTYTHTHIHTYIHTYIHTDASFTPAGMNEMGTQLTFATSYLYVQLAKVRKRRVFVVTFV